MKKNIVLMLILMGAMLYMPSVMAVDITGCAIIPNAAIDIKIANTVHNIILIIQIVVPILLVIFGMLDLFKGITAAKEDEIKKGQHTFVKRLIAAAIVFFVIAVVKLLISLVADSSTEKGIMDCASCFLNGADSDGSCK